MDENMKPVLQMMKKIPLIIFLFVRIASAQVVINEFMADNVTHYPDMTDYDDFSDWIELYNPSNTPADLTGYFITDNLNNPFKWAFPSGSSIPPHGYFVVRADGFNAVPGQSGVREYWPWDTFSAQEYHTGFKLDAAGEEIGLFKPAAITSTVLIAKGSEWKYSDNGSDPGTAWKEPGFNDSQWKSGIAQLGYGDGDENTIVNYGSSSSNKYITTYFRKTVKVNDASSVVNISIKLLRDDGAAVYINGSRVINSNLPEGEINSGTLAVSSVGGADENSYYTFPVPAEYLTDGDNLFAVEVHQSAASSSDLGFDMELNVTNGADAVLVDSVKYSHQPRDVSMGRDPADNTKWYYYGEPTPGAANTSAASASDEISGNVSFSLTSGFFTSPQTLILSAASPAGIICYTTDGSIPTSKSTRYTSPVLLNKTAVIRARVFEDNRLPGNVSSNTYFINETTSSLPSVSFITDPDFMWDSQRGIYQNNIKGREIPVSVEYFDPGNHPVFKVNAGARIGGLNIWRFAQKPLNIYLKGKYGNDNLNYRLFNSKPVVTFTSFEFRNGGDNWNTNFITDDLTESILDGQVTNAYAAYRPCIVYINGQYWGIHDLRERADLQYFASNFNVDPSGIEYMGYVEIPSPGYIIGLEVFEGKADGYNAFLNFAETNDLSVQANYEVIKQQMDVSSLIDYISVESFAANTSWRHNREWWRSTTGDNKWRWLIQDLDRGFNMSNINSNTLSSYSSNYSLFSSLIENTEFKNRFIQQFAAHLNSTFNPSRINNIIDSIAAEVAPEMPRHIERWKNDDGIQSMSAWSNSINSMKSFTAQRIENVFTYINNQFGLQGTSLFTVNLNNPASGKISVNGIPLCSGLNNLRFFKNIPMEVAAVPAPGYRFAGWSGINGGDTVIITLTGSLTVSALFEPNGDITLTKSINVNTTLASGNTYISEGDINVPPGVTLTVEDGVVIKMGEGSNINIKGTLLVKGSEDRKVIILPNSASGVKKWGSVCFDNASGKNKISHAVIKGGSAGSDPVNQKAAVSCLNSDVELDNINIDSVSFPVFALGGNLVLKNSVLKAYSTCDYVGVKRGKALIENNTFFGNKFPDTDAIDFDGDSGSTIKGNRIYNFNGFNCDAVDIGEECSDILVTGNIIYNPRDKGVSVGQHSRVRIEKNIIADADMAVAVKDYSYALVVNNTFYRNNTGVACYEKNYNEGGGTADVINTIISASKSNSVFADSLSSVNVSYSFSDMDIIPGTANKFGDPLFVNSRDFNIELKANSPCINSGDPAGLNDEDGTEADIGAYYIYNENDIPSVIREPFNPTVVINEILYNDGIADTKDWVELYNPSGSAVNLSAWILTDKDSLHKFNFPAGTVLNSDEYIVICRDTAKFREAGNVSVNYIGNLPFGFDGSDKVVLYDNCGSIINFVSYTGRAPWPEISDIKSGTLELRSPVELNYLVTNWKKSEGSGTPGRQNNSYIPAAVEVPGKIPLSFSLKQNYPNPFNPSTTIEYSLPAAAHVKITVYDILGRETAVLLNRVENAGSHKINFNALTLSSGIYFYRLETAGYSGIRKMLLIK